MMLAAVGLLLSLGIGALVVFMLAPRPQSPLVIVLQLVLALGVGLSLTTATHFISLNVFGQSDARLLLLDVALLVGLAVAAMVTNRAGPSHDLGEVDEIVSEPVGAATSAAAPGVLQMVIVGATVLACVCAMATSLSYFIGRPHGDWDAWALWNMRARFLYRGGEDWRLAFAPELSGVRPDYPLFRPLMVARLWTLLGSESSVVARMVMAAFSFGTAVLLFTGVTRRVGVMMGCVALSLYVGAPVVSKEAASQFADVPLAFFFLAAIVSAVSAIDARRGVNRLLALAGLCAGCAAWTKNEGVPFTLALVLCTALVMCRRRGLRPGLRSTLVMVAGATPMLLLVATAKLSLVWKSDLFEERGIGGIVSLLVVPSRWREVGHWFVELLPGIVSPWLIGLLVVFVIVNRWRGPSSQGSRRSYGAHAGGATLALVAIGYMLIYVSTPHDIGWHLRTSLNRLILHLWPGVIYIFVAGMHCPSAGATCDHVETSQSG